MTSHPIRRRRLLWRTLPRRVPTRRVRLRWGPERLDPAGRLRPPGRSTILRAALVAALLLAAATVGYRDLRTVETAGPPPGPVPGSAAEGPTAAPPATPSAAPAPAGEDGIDPATDPATGWPEGTDRWPGEGGIWPPGDGDAWPGDPGTGHTGSGSGSDSGSDHEPVRLPVPEGMVGVAVPLAEPAMLAVLRPGDRVDLLSVPEGGGEPLLVAGDAGVLAVDPTDPALLLSLTDDQARVVLSARPGTVLAVTVRP